MSTALTANAILPSVDAVQGALAAECIRSAVAETAIETEAGVDLQFQHLLQHFSGTCASDAPAATTALGNDTPCTDTAQNVHEPDAVEPTACAEPLAMDSGPEPQPLTVAPATSGVFAPPAWLLESTSSTEIDSRLAAPSMAAALHVSRSAGESRTLERGVSAGAAAPGAAATSQDRPIANGTVNAGTDANSSGLPRELRTPRAGSFTRTPNDGANPSRLVDGNALLMSFGAAPHAPVAQHAQPPERAIGVPVHHPRWADGLAHEIRWCVRNEVQGATLRLSPEHLGPVEVRLEMNDERVNVGFSAAQAETRAALDQALPRLRELLQGAGLSLGQVNVQAETRRESPPQHHSPRGSASAQHEDPPRWRPAYLGLIDEYA